MLVIAPVAEELVYRGVLWRALEQRGATAGRVRPLPRLAHRVGRSGWGAPLHVASAAAAGLVFGALPVATGGVALPALVHCAVNTALLTMRNMQ